MTTSIFELLTRMTALQKKSDLHIFSLKRLYRTLLSLHDVISSIAVRKIAESERDKETHREKRCRGEEMSSINRTGFNSKHIDERSYGDYSYIIAIIQ